MRNDDVAGGKPENGKTPLETMMVEWLAATGGESMGRISIRSLMAFVVVFAVGLAAFGTPMRSGPG